MSPWLACFLVTAAGCGKHARECRDLTTRANAFIADSQKARPEGGVTKEQTREQTLVTAERYERLHRDLGDLGIESSDLLPEVESYRALALRSAAALKDVARALENKDFETARRKRVELANATKEEAPLVERINAICAR
jgi:hypothetical protein